MEQLFKNSLEEERQKEAVLVSVFIKGGDDNEREASLAELERLLETAGGKVFARMIQYKDHPDAGSYLGSGKIEELSELCKNGGIDLVICDDELSPMQIRNLEDAIEGDVQVIDRTMLILDIFALHAATAEGKLQVELAQLKYSAPRLVGHGKAMSRLGGGIGTRGPGESKLEIDRRRMKERIRILENEMESLKKTRELQRKQRERAGIFRFAIAGYTNAGKSTLLNALTGAGVKEKDELFATLDPTTRKYALPSGTEVLLTDTVGFIRNLPHHLVKAFRSTLEEVANCDGVLIVIDVSDPECGAQLKVTTDLLAELGAADKPTLYLLNKCDVATTLTLPMADHSLRGKLLPISAKTGEGIDTLLEKLEETATGGMHRVKLAFSHAELGLISGLYADAKVEHVEYTAEGAVVEAVLDARMYGRMKKYIV